MIDKKFAGTAAKAGGAAQSASLKDVIVILSEANDAAPTQWLLISPTGTAYQGDVDGLIRVLLASSRQQGPLIISPLECQK